MRVVDAGDAVFAEDDYSHALAGCIQTVFRPSSFTSFSTSRTTGGGTMKSTRSMAAGWLRRRGW